MAFTRDELARIRRALFFPQPPEIQAEILKLLERETIEDAPEEPLEDWRLILIDAIREKRDFEVLELYQQHLAERGVPLIVNALTNEALKVSMLQDAVSRVLRWTARNLGSKGPANEDWLNLRRTYIRIVEAMSKAQEKALKAEEGR